MTSPSTPNTISGRSAFIELLQSEGVTHQLAQPERKVVALLGDGSV